jgi:hypothetical protein
MPGTVMDEYHDRIKRLAKEVHDRAMDEQDLLVARFFTKHPDADPRLLTIEHQTCATTHITRLKYDGDLGAENG